MPRLDEQLMNTQQSSLPNYPLVYHYLSYTPRHYGVFYACTAGNNELNTPLSINFRHLVMRGIKVR